VSFRRAKYFVIASCVPAFGPTLMDETFSGMGYYMLSVGKEVDISLVRKSPVASWTRGALMTLTGAKGSDALEHAS
jgi:hypothetical protein